MITVKLANRLADDGIIAVAVHPGLLRTALATPRGELEDPAVGAAELVTLIDGLTIRAVRFVPPPRRHRPSLVVGQVTAGGDGACSRPSRSTRRACGAGLEHVGVVGLVVADDPARSVRPSRSPPRPDRRGRRAPARRSTTCRPRSRRRCGRTRARERGRAPRRAARGRRSCSPCSAAGRRAAGRRASSDRRRRAPCRELERWIGERRALVE